MGRGREGLSENSEEAADQFELVGLGVSGLVIFGALSAQSASKGSRERRRMEGAPGRTASRMSHGFPDSGAF